MDETIKLVKTTINGFFVNKEPWQIAAITATTTFTTVWLWNYFYRDEDSILVRNKKLFFKLARYIPSVRNKIAREMDKLEQDFQNDVVKSTKGQQYYTKLPSTGIDAQELLRKLDEYIALGEYNWKSGKISGAIYNYDQKLCDLLTTVYGRTLYTNPLHSDLFPGINKMEAEVVRMTATLFNGNDDTCGTMTTGGTESIMMACKAYRDYGKDVKGIDKPNIVVPRTAHSAFDKAAQYLGLYVKSIPIDAVTTEVDLRKMERAINSNTIMLVGSAPNFPYGTMDNIEHIAALGKKYNIPVHVDACLGGFVIVFMKKAGFDIRPFDFSVVGVTSISADPHKYGYTPKGSSIILYSNKEYRKYQFTVTTDWPGGVYGSPSVCGSRAGGIIATCWATMMNYGESGYIETTKRVLETARYIEDGLKTIEGIYIYGIPATTVIAIGSNDFDIFRLSENLSKLGWNLNALQFPSGIHLCVTYMHTKDDIAQKFVADVRANVAELMLSPSKPVEGKMAVYGVAQALPDRTLVSDLTRLYIDSKYYTPASTAAVVETSAK